MQIANLTQQMNQQIFGAPRAMDNLVWFQGEGNALLRLDINDPTKVINPQGQKTYSPPTPCSDGYVYYRGHNDRLMRIMREEPYLYCFYEPTPGTTFDTFHSPGVAGDGFVYVTDDQHQLARIATNGEAFEILAAQANANTEPFISCPSTGYLFYGKRGTGDDGLPLYRFDVSAKTEEAVRTGRVIATLQSGALAAMDGMLYFNHDLEILAVSQTNISSVKSVSGAPARGKPGKRTNYPIAIGTRGPHPYKILIYAYSNGKDNVLHWEGLTALQMDFSTLPIAAAPSVCGDGRVVCRGKDNNLYIANFIH